MERQTWKTGLGIAGAVVLTAVAVAFIFKPNSPEVAARKAEEKRFNSWVQTQHSNCRARRSNGAYNSDTKEFKCFRTPLMREPILQFTATYGGKTVEAEVNKGPGWTKFKFSF